MLELRFENETGEEITGPITFDHTVKGIPNRATPLYVHNVSALDTFSGEIFVSPDEGRSYSEDLKIALMIDGERLWQHSHEINLEPDERIGIYIRVNPRATPSGMTGGASIYAARSV